MLSNSSVPLPTPAYRPPLPKGDKHISPPVEGCLKGGVGNNHERFTKNYMEKSYIKHFFKTYSLELFLFPLFLIFSVWLMFSTFLYKNGSMFIATKAWSDFANHIPLIRSFSFGSNFPPQDPLFSGEPIHYHFLFYMFVGFLEKFGVRIDYALNIPSALGFFALLAIIYIFAKKLFHSKSVALLSVMFFLWNGTLSFVEFFKKHPLSIKTPQDIITNTTFPSFGPYDHKIVSAFWNLNIYTNQRHLAAAYALGLIIIYLVLFHSRSEKNPPHLQSRHPSTGGDISSWVTLFHDPLGLNEGNINWDLSVILGFVLGFSFFFHLAVFLMTSIVLGCLFLFFKKLRIPIFIILCIAGILAIPQYWYLRSSTEGSGFGLQIIPGYLVSDHLTFLNFVTYWFYNFGLHFILIPIGFFIAPKNIKKLFIAFLVLFFVGNIFQFAPEMAENHKFFNFFLLFGSMLSAYVLVTLWKKSIYTRPFVIVITFFLLLSGIIDFFPVYNDNRIALADYPVNADVKWIIQHTPPDAIILNTNYLYDIDNIAGRRIFLGWPYFPWSAGFDTTTRSNQIKQFFAQKDTIVMCNFLTKNNLSYVTLTTPTEDFPFDQLFWQQHFTPVYNNTQTKVSMYKTSDICKNS